MCELSQEPLNCGPNPELVNTCGADMFQYVSDVVQCFCTLRNKSLVKFNCEDPEVKRRLCKSLWKTAAAKEGMSSSRSGMFFWFLCFVWPRYFSTSFFLLSSVLYYKMGQTCPWPKSVEFNKVAVWYLENLR